ncbi:hypothetical protein BC829DRAFT_178586 [Chytridium lagenaria]|nr:hypothetical protein BC829DRAFT_178586 [Chytridium lagenaria]
MASAKGASSEGSFFEYSADVAIEHFLHRNLQSAVKAIMDQIRNYRRLRSGPTMLALQSSLSNFELLSAGFSIFSDIPYMRVPAHPQDSNFPAVGWQQQSSRRMFSHVFNVKEWLSERLHTSEYGAIPIGNLETDYPIFLSDVFYARRLIRHNFVLWYNDDRRPDLGGRELDENRMSSWTPSPEQFVPGSYSNVCIEIDLYNMAFNTILQWTHLSDLEDDVSKIYAVSNDFQKLQSLQEAEGQEKLGAPVNMAQSVDERAPNMKSLKILREMVQLWHVQFESQQNRSAEMMLEHFDRWLTDPASRLYDPAIYELIQRLICKIFNSLVEHFKSLGSTVVYAGFERMILCTCKPSIEKAITYAQFATDSVRKQPLFSYLDIQITHYWGNLLWLDKYNYGGVLHCGQQSMTDGDADDSDNFAIDMKWGIMDILPSSLHDELRSIIGDFLCDISQRKTAVESEVSTEIVISKGIRRKLLTIIPNIMQNHYNVSMDESVQSDGIHAKRNAALNLIKVVCAILELETLAAREVRSLRRDLLNLIGLREFGETTKFENPFQSFILARTVCSYCSLVHDLDLTKPGSLTADSEGINGANTSVPVLGWPCPECGTEYQQDHIESKLMDCISSLMLQWQTQDVSCHKCRLTRPDELSALCKCSGNTCRH